MQTQDVNRLRKQCNGCIIIAVTGPGSTDSRSEKDQAEALAEGHIMAGMGYMSGRRRCDT